MTTKRRRHQRWVAFGALCVLNAAVGIVTNDEWGWQVLHLLTLIAWTFIVYREVRELRRMRSSPLRARKGLS